MKEFSLRMTGRSMEKYWENERDIDRDDEIVQSLS